MSCLGKEGPCLFSACWFYWVWPRFAGPLDPVLPVFRAGVVWPISCWDLSEQWLGHGWAGNWECLSLSALWASPLSGPSSDRLFLWRFWGPSLAEERGNGNNLKIGEKKQEARSKIQEARSKIQDAGYWIKETEVRSQSPESRKKISSTQHETLVHRRWNIQWWRKEIIYENISCQLGYWIFIVDYWVFKRYINI